MPLRIEETNAVTTAIIERPEAMNAINFELMDRLEDSLTSFPTTQRVGYSFLQAATTVLFPAATCGSFTSLKRRTRQNR